MKPTSSGSCSSSASSRHLAVRPNVAASPRGAIHERVRFRAFVRLVRTLRSGRCSPGQIGVGPASLGSLLTRQPEPPAVVLNEPSCYHFRVLDPRLTLRFSADLRRLPPAPAGQHR